MEKVEPFEKHYRKYEKWFERNKWVYLSEIECLKKLVPKSGIGIEVGVGSGRFAIPFGIKIGVEPSERMARISVNKGIFVVKGTGEDLPFFDNSFDYILMVTTVCFLNNISKSFKESYRVLKRKGKLIVGLVDRDSFLGKIYEKEKKKNVFYRVATFYSCEEIIKEMEKAGFKNIKTYQTIFKPLYSIKKIEIVKKGYGEGSFVGIRGEK